MQVTHQEIDQLVENVNMLSLTDENDQFYQVLKYGWEQYHQNKNSSYQLQPQLANNLQYEKIIIESTANNQNEKNNLQFSSQSQNFTCTNYSNDSYIEEEQQNCCFSIGKPIVLSLKEKFWQQEEQQRKIYRNKIFNASRNKITLTIV